MDELEIEQLGERLRTMAVGHKPAAPADLLAFIDTVPACAPAERRFALPVRLGHARRGAMGLVAAAAVVIALVASSALISYRSNQAGNSGPGAWSWQRADGTQVRTLTQVAHGYIASCGPAEISSDELCSSPDGLHWTRPADPAIVSVEGSEPFIPTQVVKSGSAYAALSWRKQAATSESPVVATPIDCTPPNGCSAQPGTTGLALWQSSDGLHWSEVHQGSGAVMEMGAIGLSPDGFIALANSADGSAGWAFTSSDGVTWSRSSRLPVTTGSMSMGGEAGEFISSGGAAGEAWRTLDGKAWTRVSLPSGDDTVGPSLAIPGGFIGITNSSNSSGNSLAFSMVRSADGVTWRHDSGDLPGMALNLLNIGGRLVATVSDGPVDIMASPASMAALHLRVMQSLDWGRTWQPVRDETGQEINGGAYQMGDRIAVVTLASSWSGELTLVGTPLTVVTPSATSTSEATPAKETPAPAATPASVASSGSSVPVKPPTSAFGWSWQPADGTDVVMAGKVARGYLGTCVGEHTMVMCSSPDGRNWSSPADPAIVTVTGGGSLWGAPVYSGGVYLAPEASFNAPPQGLGVARSTDGIHWTMLPATALLGLRPDSVWSIAGGFVVLGTSTAESKTWALTSKDGLTWTRGAEVPVSAGTVNSGAAGLYVSDYTSNWRTLDGSKWERVEAPAGIAVQTTHAVPGGGYVATGLSLTNPPNYLLRSDDGLAWRIDQGDLPGTFGGMYVVGDRLLATSSDVTATHDWTAASLWESTDWGRTWHKVTDLVSHGLAESMVQFGDSLGLRDLNGKLVWVGSLGSPPAPASPADGSAAPAN